MIKLISIILIISSLLAGCANQTTAIANPWSDWSSMEEAEKAVGFSFDLPEVIADSFEAVSYRSMNKELIEVIYRDGDYEVCVRKAAGEGQDISGDYNKYESCTESAHNGATVSTYHNSDNDAVKQLVSYDGFSWSLVAPKGFWGDSNADFLNEICR